MRWCVFSLVIFLAVEAQAHTVVVARPAPGLSASVSTVLAPLLIRYQQEMKAGKLPEARKTLGEIRQKAEVEAKKELAKGGVEPQKEFRIIDFLVKDRQARFGFFTTDPKGQLDRFLNPKQEIFGEPENPGSDLMARLFGVRNGFQVQYQLLLNAGLPPCPPNQDPFAEMRRRAGIGGEPLAAFVDQDRRRQRDPNRIPSLMEELEAARTSQTLPPIGSSPLYPTLSGLADRGEITFQVFEPEKTYTQYLMDQKLHWERILYEFARANPDFPMKEFMNGDDYRVDPQDQQRLAKKIFKRLQRDTLRYVEEYQLDPDDFVPDWMRSDQGGAQEWDAKSGVDTLSKSQTFIGNLARAMKRVGDRFSDYANEHLDFIPFKIEPRVGIRGGTLWGGIDLRIPDTPFRGRYVVRPNYQRVDFTFWEWSGERWRVSTGARLQDIDNDDVEGWEGAGWVVIGTSF